MSRVATMEAMWTKGPSFPKGIPEPSVAVRPTTFATSVLYKKKRDDQLKIMVAACKY